MEIALAVITLAVLAVIFWVSLHLRRHGLAGVLYLMAARACALADAVAIGQEQHRRSVAEYTRQAKTAAKVMAEVL